MCFFKKKKKIEITNNRFQLGDSIRFRYRGNVSRGIIYNVKLDEEGRVIYDVQIGGECPATIENIKEEELF